MHYPTNTTIFDLLPKNTNVNAIYILCMYNYDQVCKKSPHYISVLIWHFNLGKLTLWKMKTLPSPFTLASDELTSNTFLATLIWPLWSNFYFMFLYFTIYTMWKVYKQKAVLQVAVSSDISTVSFYPEWFWKCYLQM